MKIKTIIDGSFAPNAQRIISFGKGIIYESGEVHGLTEENLHRLVELNLAQHHNEDDDDEIVPEGTEDELEPEDNGEDNQGETLTVTNNVAITQPLNVEVKADFKEEAPVVVPEGTVVENVTTNGGFEDIQDKNELAQHAKDIYNVDLDKRKSIENMKQDLLDIVNKPA